MNPNIKLHIVLLDAKSCSGCPVFDYDRCICKFYGSSIIAERIKGSHFFRRADNCIKANKES